MSKTIIREQQESKGRRPRPPIRPKNTNLRASLRVRLDADTCWDETGKPDWYQRARDG